MYYERFEKLCENKGVKPATVSKATGISTATLTSWKKGRYTPKNEKLQLIADYFGVSLSYIIGADTEYYINDDTAKVAQEIFENHNLRALFDVQRDMSPEDLKAMYNMALALKRKDAD